jgi:hypothetical protein
VREAQAAREKQARIILGQAELEIAHSFAEAAKSYHENPTALHLRAMNMLYEGLKEKGALMLMPVVDPGRLVPVVRFLDRARRSGAGNNRGREP